MGKRTNSLGKFRKNSHHKEKKYRERQEIESSPESMQKTSNISEFYRLYICFSLFLQRLKEERN